MKTYLLIAGSHYYPDSGTGDWRGCFKTREEALSNITTTETEVLYKQGPRKGIMKEIQRQYFYHDEPIDWYEIIDLLEYIR